MTAYELTVADPHLLIADLRDAADEFEHRFVAPEAAARLSLLADEIEAQTGPPKPPEPTGLGAVVEDAEGDRWLRWEIVGRHPKPWTVAGAVKPNRTYSEIDVVRVLSEGVSS